MSTMKKNNLHQLLLFPLPNSQIRKFHFSGLFREMFWSPMLSSSHSCRGEGWKGKGAGRRMSRGEGEKLISPTFSTFPLHCDCQHCCKRVEILTKQGYFEINSHLLVQSIRVFLQSWRHARLNGASASLPPRPTCLLHDPLLLSLLVRRTYLEFHLFQILTLF